MRSKPMVVAVGCLTVLLVMGSARAELVGVPLGVPIISFNSGGLLQYDTPYQVLQLGGSFGPPHASPYPIDDGGNLAVDAVPLTLWEGAPPPIFITTPRHLELAIRVSGSGELLGGLAGPDLLIEGVIDMDGDGTPEYSGTLITGEVVAFGYQDTGASTDFFDFVFELTGGQLEPLFGATSLGLTLQSEESSFVGDFTEDFSGEAKGHVGAFRCLDVTKTACVVPPPPSSNACYGKVTQLSLRYTGEGCAATEHNQNPSKVSCEGDAASAEPVRIVVTNNNGDKVYADVPSVPLDGEIVAAAANAGDDHFRAETRVQIFAPSGEPNEPDLLIEDLSFHISCSQPLAPGNQFGSMFVFGMITTGGGEVVYEEPGDECLTEFLLPTGLACDGKLVTLELRYTGGDCSQSDHSQNANKVSCAGDAGDAEPVRILVTNRNGNRVWADVEGVPLGGTVFAAAANAGKGKLDSATRVRIFDADGNQLQDIEFHTSCSQPLELGDQFGAIQIFGMETNKGTSGSLGVEVEYTYTITNNSGVTAHNVVVIDEAFGDMAGGPIDEIAPGETVEITLTALVFDTTTNIVAVTADWGSAITCERTASATVTALIPPPQAEDCCDSGNKLQTVTMQYTAQNCDASQNSQDPRKVLCDEADPPPVLPEVVWIRASDKRDPNRHHAKIWFDGPVDLMIDDGIFVIDAATAGKRKLKSNTWVHVFEISAQGDLTLLQTLKFHTSCSQPLSAGDQFGSLRFLECTQQGGPVDGQYCAGGAKPKVLTMRYTGDGCDASQHSQNPDKVSCEGDPAGASPVRIRASDKEDPGAADARIWFDGQVALDETFEIDAANAGKNKLKANTWVHIFDLSDNLLQTLNFHTSCSQPLSEGDQFGSLILEGLIAE